MARSRCFSGGSLEVGERAAVGCRWGRGKRWGDGGTPMDERASVVSIECEGEKVSVGREFIKKK